MANCITNSYEKDFIVEQKLRDLRYQEHKARLKGFDYKGTTIAQEKRIKNTQRRLQVIDGNDKLNTVFSPIRCHAPGHLPKFYPGAQVEQVLDFV